jgi:hypothetical protein
MPRFRLLRGITSGEGQTGCDDDDEPGKHDILLPRRGHAEPR